MYVRLDISSHKNNSNNFQLYVSVYLNISFTILVEQYFHLTVQRLVLRREIHSSLIITACNPSHGTLPSCASARISQVSS